MPQLCFLVEGGAQIPSYRVASLQAWLCMVCDARVEFTTIGHEARVAKGGKQNALERCPAVAVRSPDNYRPSLQSTLFLLAPCAS